MTRLHANVYVSVFPKFVDLISTMYRFTMIHGTFLLDTGLPVTCLVTKVSNLSALILYIYEYKSDALTPKTLRGSTPRN